MLAKFLRVQFSIPQFNGNQVVKINSNGAHIDVPGIKRAIFHVVTCRSHDYYFCWLCLSTTVVIKSSRMVWITNESTEGELSAKSQEQRLQNYDPTIAKQPCRQGKM